MKFEKNEYFLKSKQKRDRKDFIGLRYLTSCRINDFYNKNQLFNFFIY